MKQIFSAVSTGWNLARWLRLGIGAVVILEAIKSGDSFLAMLGAIFMMQAIFNVGCCGSSGCVSPPTKSKTEASDEIDFEEVR